LLHSLLKELLAKRYRVCKRFLFFFLGLALFPPAPAYCADALPEPGGERPGLFAPLSASGEMEQLLSFDVNKELSPPVLRILYTASTWGETKPCPTCRTAYGGLARRSAYFARQRSAAAPVFVIAGPDEFLADAPRYTRPAKIETGSQPAPAGEIPENSLPAAGDAPWSLAAHMLLNVDAGFMSPRAAAWMEKNVKAIPPGFHVVHSAPVSRLVPTPAGNIGLVFFPYGHGELGAPTAEQVKSVLAAGASLRAKSVLLVGVSPWGYDAEKVFLRQGEGVFHILLGGGDGMPFAQAIAKECPSILWSRADSMGRAVTDIALMELPPSAASGERAQWLEGITFKARLVFLDDSFSSDPQMQRILP
jgi:hypothetical protein